MTAVDPLKTGTVYRIERQETRNKQPFQGQWVQDQFTGFKPVEDRDAAVYAAKNPIGPLAWQPHRVVEVVTTETVIYPGPYVGQGATVRDGHNRYGVTVIDVTADDKGEITSCRTRNDVPVMPVFDVETWIDEHTPDPRGTEMSWTVCDDGEWRQSAAEPDWGWTLDLSRRVSYFDRD